MYGKQASSCEIGQQTKSSFFKKGLEIPTREWLTLVQMRIVGRALLAEAP